MKRFNPVKTSAANKEKWETRLWFCCKPSLKPRERLSKGSTVEHKKKHNNGVHIKRSLFINTTRDLDMDVQNTIATRSRKNPYTMFSAESLTFRYTWSKHLIVLTGLACSRRRVSEYYGGGVEGPIRLYPDRDVSTAAPTSSALSSRRLPQHLTPTFIPVHYCL